MLDGSVKWRQRESELFGRAKQAARERASERRSREGPRKGESSSFSPPVCAFASPLACLSRVYFPRYLPNGELARRLKVSLRISPGVVDFIHGLTSTKFIFAINQNQLNYLRKTGASLLALAKTIYYQKWLDDTTVFLRNQESMNALLEILEKFERCSGLKINPTKSEAIWLGKTEE